MSGVSLPPLGGIQLELPPGEVGWLQGPSGEGKTLVLYLAAGLVAPKTGSVHLEGAPPAPEKVAMVFQNPDYQLLGATAGEDIDLNAVDPEWAREAARATGCGDLLERSPSTLTPGQRRRVALAGALASGRPLLALDTPFAGMGSAESSALWQGIQGFLEGRDTTLLVTGEPPPGVQPDPVWQVGEWKEPPSDPEDPPTST